MVVSETYEGLHGLTCTHSYSKINEFPYVNRWEYICGERSVVLNVSDMGQTASCWNQEAPATFTSRTRGEVTDRPRKFTSLCEAQRRAIQFCHRTDSETAADLEIANLGFAKQLAYTQRLHDAMGERAVDQATMARLIAQATGVDIDDPDTEETSLPIVRAYVSSMLVEELQQLLWQRDATPDGGEARAALEAHIASVESQVVEELRSNGRR